MVFGGLQEGYSDAELVTVTREASVEQVWNHQPDGRALANALVRILGAVKAGAEGQKFGRRWIIDDAIAPIVPRDTDASGRPSPGVLGGRPEEFADAELMAVAGKLSIEQVMESSS